MPSNLELRIKVGELTSFSAVTDVSKCYETVELGGKENSCIKNKKLGLCMASSTYILFYNFYLFCGID